jgi:hypothetical protein
MAFGSGCRRVVFSIGRGVLVGSGVIVAIVIPEKPNTFVMARAVLLGGVARAVSALNWCVLRTSNVGSQTACTNRGGGTKC